MTGSGTTPRTVRSGRWFGRFGLVSFVLVALLAPFLASDRPVLASIDGAWSSPALDAWLGRPTPPPDATAASWKDWWRGLPIEPAVDGARDGGGGGDWAIMPPCAFGPFESNAALVHAPPSTIHPLGNDDTGRDLLACLLHGATTAAQVAFGAVLIAALLGIPLGALAGLCGGWVDVVVLRLVELFQCFPTLIAVSAAVAFVGGATGVVVVVLGLVYWPSFARVVRGEFLSLREREFVLAARGLGVGLPSLLFRHMLPTVAGPVFVVGAFVAGNAIVAESAITFLGLGSGDDPTSWGALLKQSKASVRDGAWHLVAFPALALVAVVLCLHAVADRGGGRGGGAGVVTGG